MINLRRPSRLRSIRQARLTGLGAALCLILCGALALPAGRAAAFEWPWTQPASRAEAPPRPVVSEILGNRPREERSVPGVIDARIEVVLGFQTLGRLIERRVEIGDVVKKGDLLAALDPGDLRGNVAAANAAVEAAEVQLRTATATAERTRALASRNVSSAAALEKAEQALIAAEAASLQARSELARARDAEDFSRMNAPFSGVISDIYEETGAIVAAGAPVMKLSDDGNLEAVIDLPETALVDLDPGDPFELWSESDPQRTLAAKVRLIEPVADAATRTRRVRLSLVESGGFRIGSLIRARQAAASGDLLTVDQAAILDPDTDPHVWIVTRDGSEARISRRAVTLIGGEMAGRIAVGPELAAGDEIVTRGIHTLSDGQAVGRSVSP